MRYVIYGAGAVGSAIGAGLHQAGLPVVLVARGQHLEALRVSGLSYEFLGERRQLRIPAVGTIGEAEVQAGDTVLLCMKSQDTLGAVRELARAVSAPINVVCAQNGVENERTALRYFPDVYGMVVRIPAVFTKPGHVANRARPTAGILDLGRYPSGTDAATERIAADLTRAGFDSRAQADILHWKYGKLMDNLATPVDALFAPSPAKARVVQLAQEEARAVLARAGVNVASPEEKAERRSKAMDYDPRKDPDRPGGSVWQSLARGTGSVEVDYLTGEIVLLGRMNGVATPVNEAIQRATSRVAHEGGSPSGMDAGEFLAALGAQAAEAGG